MCENEEYLKKHAYGKRKEALVKAMNTLALIASNEPDDLDLNISIQRIMPQLKDRRKYLDTKKA